MSYQLFFYVPESHLEVVKEAIFAAGAGHVDNYECCCWQVKGNGQFRPLAGSQPFLGAQGQVEQVDEYKVEVVCDQTCLQKVLDALLGSHPYETVAYGVIKLQDVALF